MPHSSRRNNNRAFRNEPYARNHNALPTDVITEPRRQALGEDEDEAPPLLARGSVPKPTIDPRHYMIQTDWTYTGGWEGGRKMEVVLTHNASGGTSADSTKPRAMEDLRPLSEEAGLGRKYFRSGHLLSQHLGGTGTDAKNLVVLTPSGNARHLTVESLIKYAQGIIKRTFENGSGPRLRYYMAISYEVEASDVHAPGGTAVNDPAFKFVPHHLTIRLSLVKYRWAENPADGKWGWTRAGEYGAKDKKHVSDKDDDEAADEDDKAKYHQYRYVKALSSVNYPRNNEVKIPGDDLYDMLTCGEDIVVINAFPDADLTKLLNALKRRKQKA